MIKQLIDNPPQGLDLTLKKQDVLISSFNSYFNKVIKAPRSASSGLHRPEILQGPVLASIRPHSSMKEDAQSQQ